MNLNFNKSENVSVAFEMAEKGSFMV